VIDVVLHPISLIIRLLNLNDTVKTLSFSRYFYRPQSPIDEREIFSVSRGEVTLEWFNHEVARLRPGWELAFNSKIIDRRNRKFHLPMIDFASVGTSALVSENFRDIIGRKHADSLHFYRSGRSFHAYSLRLVGQSEWVKFMGRLLLLNLPESDPIIDSRWIGHRLLAGYSALRWSCQTSHYLESPSYVNLGKYIITSGASASGTEVVNPGD
jgi:hypothetical protein